jgi:hypothetical protein
MEQNVKLKEGFSQVCVWPGTVVGVANVEEFEKWMLETFGVRAQYLEEIETNPDVGKDGEPVPGTGGRNDIFFSVVTEDIGNFAIKRLAYGIRWIEDIYLNGGGYLYPDRVAKYKTW